MTGSANTPGHIGIVAGGGELPLVVARQLALRSRQVSVAALAGLADSRLKTLCRNHREIDPGRLQDCIDFLKEAGAEEAIFCGHIDHREVFSKREFDPLFQSILARPDLRADALLGAVADAFEAAGLPVADMRNHLGEHLAPEGLLGSAEPTEQANRDLGFGWPIARKIAEQNVGQAIMVRGGVVIAVEAVEGTDAMIARGGELAGPGSTVIKLPLSNKDPRFDLPVIGSSTIKSMAAVGCALLAITAGNTIIIDPKETYALADKAGIAIISKNPKWEGGSCLLFR